MITLTKDAVTLYDIETNTVWRTMSIRQGEHEVQFCYGLGDTVQEYETTDLDGNPIRVVYQIDAPSEYAKPDQGGVYVFPRSVVLPSAERRSAPDMSSPDWFAHHDTVYADPRVTAIDGSDSYFGKHSTDNGQTWQPRQTSAPWDTVYGHHVRGDVAGALLRGLDVVADGPNWIVRKPDGSLARWILRA